MTTYQRSSSKPLLTPTFDPNDPNSEVVLQRVGMTPYTNVVRQVTHHSPDGFEWGYPGSGPSDLALNIMVAIFPLENDQEGVNLYKGQCSKTAYALYQRFKEEFLVKTSEVQVRIPNSAIQAWLNQPAQQEIIERNKQ